jgi:dTMP kinase
MPSQDKASGKFIVLEGIDGSGLTTHAARLHSWLENTSKEKVYLTKEPTGGPIGALIRLALGGRLSVDDATLALMFAADRLDHLSSDIAPRLNQGQHVICDRYYLSSLVYQSLTQDADWIKAINAPARWPDLTIFIDVPAEVCVERIMRERWRAELFETEETLTRVRQNYHKFALELQQLGENIVIVPGVTANKKGGRPVQEVERDIQAAVRGIIDLPATISDNT